MKIVIDRSRWACCKASAAGAACLLNSQGRMCCLGQLGAQLGQPIEELRHLDFPRGDWPGFEAVDVYRCAAANDGGYYEADNSFVDTHSMTDEEFEEVISDLFEEAGYEVEYCGEYLR